MFVRRRHRRARGSIRLLSGPQRVPGVPLGLECGSACGSDVEHDAAAAHPVQQNHRPCPARDPSSKVQVWCSSATPWRRSSTISVAPPASLAGWGSGFHVPGGRGSDAEQAFREIARLTRGAYCRFDPGAAQQLAELLRAAAAYAAAACRRLLTARTLVRSSCFPNCAGIDHDPGSATANL